MTHFDDLDRCSYFGDDFTDSLIAVGWLDCDKPFDRGSVEQAVYDRLIELARDPWQPMVFGGVHQCDICQYDGPMAADNLFVPDGRSIFVCPSLITHYIAAHSYVPPKVFVDAILECPDTRSMDYKRLLLSYGGRVLVQNGG